MRVRHPLLLIAAGLVLAVPFAIGYRLSAGDRATSPVVVPSVVDEVRDALAFRYYRPVPTSVLHLGSIDRMISALGDPYTTYLGPSSYRLVREQTASRYSGIGASVLPSPNGLVVVSLLPGPAQRAGVLPGDTIVKVDAMSAKRLGMAGAFARILGRPGTSVRLQLLRNGQKLDLYIQRETVRAPVVDAKLLSFAGRRWGLLRLSAFRVGAAVVLRRQLELLEREGANGIVLDLRQNPGGLVDQAVAVSSLFIDHGVVVSLVGAHHPRQVFRAFPGVATNLPLVVLVDSLTASSAEIVAAALRDHQRATLVGQRTYGKALVQSLDPLDNGAALELTIAHYFTPAGDDISHVGVTPQIRAVDDPATPQDEALHAALRVLARPTS